MPELPEVARTTTNLNERIKDSDLTQINILSGRYSRHRVPPGFNEFVENLPMKIEKVSFSGNF